MREGNRRARGPRRKKRPSPADIIAGIDTSATEDVGRRSSSRRSPSRVIADALEAEASLPIRREKPTPQQSPHPLEHRVDHRPESRGKGLADGRGSSAAATQSFWAIWIEHQEYLRRRSLRWMSNDVEDAADALSNAMLLAQRKYPEYSHAITDTRAWLTRLVHNVCMDYHRAASRLVGLRMDLQQDEAEPPAALPDHRTVREPDQEVIDEELLTALLRGLQCLPASLREPLMLRCLYDLAYPEIAVRMRMTECAVRKRVQLARDKLRRWMGTI